MASSTPHPVPRSDPRPAAMGLEDEDRTIADLIADLTRESSDLFRREIELARLDLSETIGRVQGGVSSMALGTVVALAGLVVLLISAALGLDTVLHAPWLSALIVGALATLVGAGLLLAGKSRLPHLTPERSLRSLRQDGALVQEHLPGGGS